MRDLGVQIENSGLNQMAKVYVVDSNGKTAALQRIYCKNEDKELQRVLENNPDLLAGEQINPDNPRRWLIVKREMSGPDPTSGSNSWSLDFLLADQDATPTFVECKRFNDTRARREVVGQILDYAANGQYYWTKDELRSMAEESAKKLKRLSLEDALRELGATEKLSSCEDRLHALFFAARAA
jgi:hypothetical protein